MAKTVTLEDRELELLKNILSDAGDKDMLYGYWKDSMENNEELQENEVYGFKDIFEIYELHDSITSKLFD